MASFSFGLNPAGSYLSVDTPPGSPKPISATSIKLSEIGVSSGDTIAFLAQGDYKAGSQFSDNSDGLLAVFIDQGGLLASGRGGIYLNERCIRSSGCLSK
jgi:hypothetical protein